MLIYSGWKRIDIIEKMQSTTNNKWQKRQRKTRKAKLNFDFIRDFKQKHINYDVLL